MKARPTTAHWLGLALGLALLAAVLAVRQRGDLLQFAENPELLRLRAERQRLTAFEPVAMRALEAAADALDERRRSLGRWPEGWSAEPLPLHEGSDALMWRITPVQAPSWTGLMNAVSALVSVPGNRILSIMVGSRGTRSEREIASVEILVEQPTATPSRRNPSGGTGSPGVVVPSTPPAGGAGPSLRRPAASAEPPTAGQASAPARPAPRGPRAGELSTRNHNPSNP